MEKRLKRLEPPELKIERAKQSVRRLLDFNYNGIDDRLIDQLYISQAKMINFMKKFENINLSKYRHDKNS